MRLVASFPLALRIRIEVKPRLPFKLHRINRKPRYLSPSAISAFFSFLSRSTLYRSDTLQASPIEISTKTSVSSCDTNITRRNDAVPSFLRSRVPLLRRNNCNPLPLVIPLLIPFWLGGETRFQSYCLESVRRVASRRLFLTSWHSAKLSFLDLTFRFVIFDEIRRMIGLPRSEFAFDAIRYQETLSFLVLGYYCTSGVALIVKFL